MSKRNLTIHGSALLVMCLSFASASADRPAGPAVVTTTPVIRVTTENPREINVGKPATFVFSVANEGTTHASGVFVVIGIPKHVELANSNVQPTMVSELIYKFPVGDLAPKTTQKVTLVAIPRTTDPIVLDSTVIFATSARASVVVRRPELKLAATVTPQAVIGTEVDWTVSVSNTGDGIAESVVVTPSLLAGEVAGQSLSQAIQIGSLKAGETKEVQFTVIPSLRGNITAKFEGSNPDGLVSSQESTFQVLQPELSVAAYGPQVQPIAREGLYEIHVSNPGDAPTDSVFVKVQVPEGIQITSAAENAFDSKNRTLRWRITEIQPGAIVPIRFQAEPTVEGDLTISATVQSEKIGEAIATQTTNVISRPNPVVTVMNDQEFSPIGAAAGFRVNVINAGSKTADQLRVRVALPAGLEAIESANYEVQDGMIVFPVQKLESGAKATLAFHAIGRQAGEQRVRILVDGIGLANELTFEGSAFCYPAPQAAGENQAPRSARRTP